MPPPSGKLIRGTTGRLARSADGLSRCACCAAGDRCSLVVLAHPCWMVLDPADCTREFPADRWVCMDYVPPGESEPIGDTDEKVLNVSTDYCVKTVPGSRRLFSDLSGTEQAAVIFTGTLVADCSDASCGPDPDYDLCDCVCYTYATQDPCGDDVADPLATFCCYGKVVERYDETLEATRQEICVDWSYTGWLKHEITSETFHTPPSLGCGTFSRCAVGGACIVEYWEFRNTPDEDLPYPQEDRCHRLCGFTNGCQSRHTISKVWGSGDPGYGPCFSGDPAYTCGNTNKITSPSWSGSGTCMVITGGAGAMAGAEVGSCEFDIEYAAASPTVDGCTSPAVVGHFEYTQTCDSGTVDYTETSQAYLTGAGGQCPDAEPGDWCCCSFADIITEHHQITINRPNKTDPECGQCLAYLVANGL